MASANDRVTFLVEPQDHALHCCAATPELHRLDPFRSLRRLTKAQVNTKRTILNIDLLNQRHELCLRCTGSERSQFFSRDTKSFETVTADLLDVASLRFASFW